MYNFCSTRLVFWYHFILFTDTGRVAFSALLASHYTTVNNGKLVLSHVLVNNGGAYDGRTGIFTCKVPGTYLFSWALHKSSGTSASHCQLMLNKDVAFTQYVYRAKDDYTGSLMVNLQRGDTVWLRTPQAGANMYANKHTSWSGLLL